MMGVGRLRQFHTAFASGFGSLVMGGLNVWPSYTSHLYTSNTTNPLSVPMTSGEVSMLGSLPSLGAMIGTAALGWVINKIGRRNGGVLFSLPFVLSWAIISATTSINLILAARFLAGVAGGAFLGLAPIYTSEVAEDAIRGALASAPIYLYTLGSLISYLLGWFLSYKTIIWTQLILSVVGTLLLTVVVESPVFLVRQKRDEDARLAIAKYRGVPVSSMVVLDELSRLKNQILPSIELISITDTETTKAEEAEKEKLNSEEIVPEQPQPISTIKLLFLSSTSRRAFLTVFVLISLQVFMGIVPVQVYAKTVFNKMDPSKADLYTVIFAVVMMLGSSVTALAADKLGRRILLIASSSLVCVCMVSLGYFLQSATGPPWVIISLILVYCFSYMFGAASVPYVLLAEVFVSEVQTLASTIIIESVWFLNFFIIGVFPFMTNLIGIYGVFYFFGAVAMCNAVFAVLFVPETKGLSNEQIQDVFMSRKKI